MKKLPLRYRIINRLIRWTGRQFREDHLGRWYPKEGGGLERRSIPLGCYSLRTRAEAGLRQDATNIERFAAKHGINLKRKD